MKLILLILCLQLSIDACGQCLSPFFVFNNSHKRFTREDKKYLQECFNESHPWHSSKVTVVIYYQKYNSDRKLNKRDLRRLIKVTNTLIKSGFSIDIIRYDHSFEFTETNDGERIYIIGENVEEIYK